MSDKPGEDVLSVSRSQQSASSLWLSNRQVYFVILSVGMMAMFMFNSFFEEYAFNGSTEFSFSGFLTTQELIGFSMLALLHEMYLKSLSLKFHSKTSSIHRISIVFKQATVRNAPLSSYVKLTLSLTTARILTYLSLAYLNYPTQVIFKSMKLPVVIIGNFLMLGKIYPAKDYLSALAMSFSACMFSLGDSEVSPDFGMLGIFIVVMSLVGDATFSNMQEKILQTHGASSSEMLMYSNGFGGLVSLIGSIATGEFADAVSHLIDSPVLILMLILRSLILYAAVLCVVKMIQEFGVVASTFVTTLRKILSILLSFLIFPKPFSSKYILALIVFVLGISMQVNLTTLILYFQSRKNSDGFPQKIIYGKKVQYVTITDEENPHKSNGHQTA